MLDLRWVVQNLDEVKTRLESRGAGVGADLARIAELAAERKKLRISFFRSAASRRRAPTRCACSRVKPRPSCARN
jgi:seryl-tRNA synthetase